MPIRVRVLYFAHARDAAGRSSESVTVEDGATAGGLLDSLVKAHQGLGPLKSSIRLSVNQQIVKAGARLRDGDEVAVLPPVAGG